MSVSVLKRRPAFILVAAWSLVLALAAAAMLSMTGASLTPKATAATQNVTVGATVGVALTINVPGGTCGAAQNPSLAITLGDPHSVSQSCVVQFGGNDATIRLRVEDTTAIPFLGTIPNTASACAALGAGDEAGMKVIANSVNAVPTCAASGTAVNNHYRAVPGTGSPMNVCDSNLVGAAHSCTAQWAVAETGAPLAAGSYNGTAQFSVVDF